MNNTTMTIEKLESVRVAPSFDDAKFVWSYAKRNGHEHSKAPVACASIMPDYINDGGAKHLIGFGIGFSYCSGNDAPNKTRGRHLATTRALVAIRTLRCHRTRYGKNKTEIDSNGEPHQTGHVMFLYISADSFEQIKESFKNFARQKMLPENNRLTDGIYRYMENAFKHGKL